MVRIRPLSLKEHCVDIIIGYPEPDKVPRDFFRLRNGENFDTVFDRFLLFLESLFIAMKGEVEKLPTQVDTFLPILWYNHLGDRKTRQKIYEEVVVATEASRILASMAFKKINHRVEIP